MWLIKQLYILSIVGVFVRLSDEKIISVLQLDSTEDVHLTSNITYEFKISDIPKRVAFIVFQVHTQQSNVTVSLTQDWIYGQSEWGNHVGVIRELLIHQTEAKFFVTVNDVLNSKTNAIILATGYDSSYPVPGGCNMEFPLKDDPNIFLNFTRYSVKLEFEYAKFNSARSSGSAYCALQIAAKRLTYDLYVYFMPGHDLSEKTYIKNIKNILTVDGVKEHGKKIRTFSYNKGKTEIVTPAFEGIPSVYIVLVKEAINVSPLLASYVPATTYACDFHDIAENCCNYHAQIPFKITCSVLGLFGLFLCFFGHKYFKYEMFVFGFLTLAILSAVLFGRFTSFNEIGMLVAVMVPALLGGIVWLVFWWFCGIPVLSVILGVICTGCLLTSLIFAVTPLGLLSILSTELTFGLSFSCGVLILPLLLIAFSRMNSIISCSFIGSYSAVLIADVWTGGTLHYILKNIYRKCVHADFISAAVFIPLRTQEIILLVVWGALFVMGTATQIYQERLKPPFPPCPYQARRGIQSERISVHRRLIPPNEISVNQSAPDDSDDSIINERRALLTENNQANLYGQN